MSIKSKYFKMGKAEFENYLNNLKNSTNSIHLLDNTYFFNLSFDCLKLIITLNQKLCEFDSLINSFSNFSKIQIIQSFLISEIESTNKIENINSTRHDIFSILNNLNSSNDKKIISISNVYKQMIISKGTKISTCEQLRNLYDTIFKNFIDKNDLPDGKYFRKENVFISNGIKAVHTGLVGEDNIIKAIDEFIKIYNSDLEMFTKMILCHFIFEYVHPFYDGNGRFSRFLFSNQLYLETNSIFSFVISKAFENQKDKYYKSFEYALDRYEFGYLNKYFETIIKILLDEIDKDIIDLKKSKNKTNKPLDLKLTKSEEKIYKLILESSIFSDFGISAIEIIKETKISKRTLIYTLNKFKNEFNLKVTKIGKYNFYKLDI